MHFQFSLYVYFFFVLFGILAFVELLKKDHSWCNLTVFVGNGISALCFLIISFISISNFCLNTIKSLYERTSVYALTIMSKEYGPKDVKATKTFSLSIFSSFFKRSSISEIIDLDLRKVLYIYQTITAFIMNFIWIRGEFASNDGQVLFYFFQVLLWRSKNNCSDSGDVSGTRPAGSWLRESRWTKRLKEN